MNDIFAYVEKHLKDITKVKYEKVSEEEKDYWILYILKELNKPLPIAGSHRKDDWEEGWSRTNNGYIPGYFGKYPVIRLNREFYKSKNDAFEYKSLCGLQNYIFKNYLGNFSNIYEFGCGTGHNLFRVRGVNQDANLYGLDWTESGVARVNDLPLTKTEGILFDMFNPDLNFEFKPDSAVLTVASMEQLGQDYHAFVDFLISKSPSVIVHIEPIPELLDRNNLLDYLSIKYMEKRNYLKGYLDYITSHKDTELVYVDRSYVGSLFIDGYSVIVWKVV